MVGLLYRLYKDTIPTKPVPGVSCLGKTSHWVC